MVLDLLLDPRLDEGIATFECDVATRTQRLADGDERRVPALIVEEASVPAVRSRAYNLNGKGDREDEAMTIGYNAKAYRLLEAIHDLAGGDPQKAVLSARVSARTGIPNTYRAFTSPSTYLKELGLIRTTGTTGTGVVGMFLITPTGIRLVEALRTAG